MAKRKENGVKKNAVWVIVIGAVATAIFFFFRKKPQPQACSVDTDCPDGYICVDGVCVPL